MEANNDAPNLPMMGYVRLKIVAQIVGAGKSTIWRWVKKGTFPKPHQLGPRCTGWRADEVRRWIISRPQK